MGNAINLGAGTSQQIQNGPISSGNFVHPANNTRL